MALSLRLPRGRFARRLAALSGATALGQAIAVAAAPLLTRLYTPEQFGLFAVFAAFVAIATPAMALRYEFAVPVNKRPLDVAGTMAVAFAAVLGTSALAGLALWAAGPALLALAGAEALSAYRWLLGLSFLVYGLALPLTYWTIREGRFKLNGASLIGQMGSQTLVQLALGAAGAGAFGLIAGYFAGMAVRLGWLAAALPSRVRRRLALHAKGSGLKRLGALAKRHGRYPLLSAPSSFLQAAAQALPAVLLAALFGPAAAGWFALGQRVVALPVRFLGQAASHAFLAEATERDGAALHRLFKRTALRFLALGAAGGVPLALIAPWLFAFVFGEGWREAGEIVRLLVPVFVLRFAWVPVSQALNMLGRQDFDLLVSAGVVAAMGLGFGWGAFAGWGLMATVALYAALSSLAQAAGLALAAATVRRAAGRR